jgi:hypothetical protein
LGQDGKSLVILLCGATKATQGADIANAMRYWQDYRRREMPRSVPYDDYPIEALKDRRRAEAYFKAALEDDDPRVFLLALRDVAQGRGIARLPPRAN